jgi:PAS domain-containing protein
MRDYARTMHDRIATMRERARGGPPDGALEEAFQELEVTREELTVADEELTRVARVLEEANQRAETMLRHYRELFDGAPDGYAVTNSHGIIREANRTLSAMLGVHPQFLEGKPLMNFVVRGDVREFRAMLTRIAEKPQEAFALPSTEGFCVGMRPRHKQQPIFDADVMARPVRGVRDQVVSIRWSIRRKAPVATPTARDVAE